MTHRLIGLDVGNGSTKIVTSDAGQQRIPSYYIPAPSGSERPQTGFFEYVSGDRAALAGKAWMVGERALEKRPDRANALSGEKTGKIDNALQMLLGALSYVAPESQTIELVCSIHQIALKDAVAQALQGTHRVKFNASDEISEVTINVLRVWPEGRGAAFLLNLASGTSIVYDLGNGTTIATVYGDGGCVVDRFPADSGFESLVNAIATDGDVIRRAGDTVNPRNIRAAIEQNETAYGVYDTVDFSAAFDRELKAWANESVKTVLRATKPFRANAKRLVAIGGGVMLPTVADALRKQGIEPAADPVFANALGLLKLAQKTTTETK